MTRRGYIGSRSLRQRQRRRLWRRCCEWPQTAVPESESGAKTGLFSSFRGETIGRAGHCSTGDLAD
jgi:hypothetical protein